MKRSEFVKVPIKTIANTFSDAKKKNIEISLLNNEEGCKDVIMPPH